MKANTKSNITDQILQEKVQSNMRMEVESLHEQTEALLFHNFQEHVVLY